MKTLDFKAALVQAPAAVVQATKAAVARVRAAVGMAKPRATNQQAQRELERRAEINARGDAMRAARARAIFGGRGPWIEPRPDWLQRRR